MNNKNTLFVIILITGIRVIFSQTSSTDNSAVINIIKPENLPAVTMNTHFEKITDFNNAEITEDKITYIEKNELWVKNISLITKENSVIKFAEKIYKDDVPLMDQLNSDFGYILYFDKKFNIIEVYIADKYGRKNSDVIFLEY